MKKIFASVLLFLPLAAQTSSATVDRLLDRIIERETTFLDAAKKRTPVIETYIQEEPELSERPNKDHYFLGRFRLGEAVGYETLIDHTDAPQRKHSSQKDRPMTF